MSKAQTASEMGIVIDSQQTGEKFVRSLLEHPAFCDACLAPLRVNPVVDFVPDSPMEAEPIQTESTHSLHTPTEDYPIGEYNETHRTVELSRAELTICDCGEIDVTPSYTRPKDVEYVALKHCLLILEENGTQINLLPPLLTLKQAYENQETGKFCEMLGKAVYRSVSDS